MRDEKLTVLIVGGGGREHAIAWKLAQSPRLGRLYAAPGNAGIAELATCLPVAATDLDGQVRAAQEIGADLVIVGPDDPLAMGLVDRLEAAGIRAVGPTAAAARLEASKEFAKDLMALTGIPTASYEVVQDLAAATKAIERHFAAGQSAAPLVVKADGLALGKGVVICATRREALDTAGAMLSGEAFGAAGKKVILEEYLTGPEVSVLAFSDGERIIPMPPAQDHKRLLAGDEGPNTGGMGTISPVPACDFETHEDILRRCVQPVIDVMARSRSPFRGILFAGLMLTPDGPKVLEYNARFGDPEAQSLLRRLDSDLLEIFLAIAAGDVTTVQPRWSTAAACCIVMASGGYPGPYEKGHVITGLDGLPDDVVVFHAGTARNEKGELVTNGGRVLGVTATGPRLDAALDTAYAACAQIDFAGRQYRPDIGRVGQAPAR